jgi:hypothetical protein
MTEELTRIDSAVAGLSISPKDEKTEQKTEQKTEKKGKHRRLSSTATGVRNINDLGKTILDICCLVEIHTD